MRTPAVRLLGIGLSALAAGCAGEEDSRPAAVSFEQARGGGLAAVYTNRTENPIKLRLMIRNPDGAAHVTLLNLEAGQSITHGPPDDWTYRSGSVIEIDCNYQEWTVTAP